MQYAHSCSRCLLNVQTAPCGDEHLCAECACGELSLLRTEYAALQRAVAASLPHPHQRTLVEAARQNIVAQDAAEHEYAKAHRDDLETRDTQPPPKSEG